MSKAFEEFERLMGELMKNEGIARHMRDHMRRQKQQQEEYRAAQAKLAEGIRAMWDWYDKSRRRELAEEPSQLDPAWVKQQRQECLAELFAELSHPTYTESDLWVMHEAMGVIQTYPTDD
jgi:hypothetical protein